MQLRVVCWFREMLQSESGIQRSGPNSRMPAEMESLSLPNHVHTARSDCPKGWRSSAHAGCNSDGFRAIGGLRSSRESPIDHSFRLRCAGWYRCVREMESKPITTRFRGLCRSQAARRRQDARSAFVHGKRQGSSQCDGTSVRRTFRGRVDWGNRFAGVAVALRPLPPAMGWRAFSPLSRRAQGGLHEDLAGDSAAFVAGEGLAGFRYAVPSRRGVGRALFPPSTREQFRHGHHVR